MIRTGFAFIVLGALAASSANAANIYKVNSATTSSTLFGGDRQLNTLGFTGSSDVFTNANFMHWTNGSLTNNVGTFGWNDPMLRDMGSSNIYSGNVDRADNSTALGGEGSSTGTLKDVFGSFGGYKNMSYIIDGEDNGEWHMDLLLDPSAWITPDASATSVELAVLERGGNSDFKVYGIKADGSLTSSLFVSRNDTGKTGWALNTLEIADNQNVHGVGVSLDQSWGTLKGIRIKAKSEYNGPDIVAVGVVNPVPTPGALALLVSAGIVAHRRRRS